MVKFRWAGFLAMSLMVCRGTPAQTSQMNALVAPTPPMGWNSWDAYGLTITEEQFRANVKVLATQLKPFGWNYAVIDEGWFFYNPQDRPHPDTLHYALDANGRYVPVPARFPSAGDHRRLPPPAADAGRPKARRHHRRDQLQAARRLGPRAGPEVRHPHRARDSARLGGAQSAHRGQQLHAQDAADTTDACPWDPTNWGVKDNAAGQAWYDSLLQQYADWGVDLLKVDCISDHPYKADEIRMIRRAIDKTGRPIVLRLSPGPTNLSHADEVGSARQHVAHLQRRLGPLDATPKPGPQRVSSQFARLAAWAQVRASPATGPTPTCCRSANCAPRPATASRAPRA